MAQGNELYTGWIDKLANDVSQGNIHKLITGGLIDLDGNCNYAVRTIGEQSNFYPRDWASSTNPNVIYRQIIRSDSTESWYNVTSSPPVPLSGRPADAIPFGATPKDHFSITTIGTEMNGNYVHTIDLASIIPNYNANMDIRVTAHQEQSSVDLHTIGNYDGVNNGSVRQLINQTGNNHNVIWYIEVFV